MNLADVMTELGQALETIPDLRVSDHPPDRARVPMAIVSYPDGIDFHTTKGRGQDRMEIPVVVLVGRTVDRATRDNLADYANGSGSLSVVEALEGHTYTALNEIHVPSVEFDVYDLADVEYLAAIFTVQVIGPGQT